MTPEELDKIKKFLFVIGGIFSAILGMWFSKSGFGVEVEGLGWMGDGIGWGLGFLCLIVQVAFSSQLAYGSYNYVIFVCGILAYIYSGWSNWVGIMSISPNVNPAFALMLGEFLDWIAEPLIVFGLVGVLDTGEGDFLRNLFNRRTKSNSSKPYSVKTPTTRKDKYKPTHRPKFNANNENAMDGFLELRE